MNNDKISSVISLIVAITISVASFLQWWHITSNGKIVLRKWVKIVLSI